MVEELELLVVPRLELGLPIQETIVKANTKSIKREVVFIAALTVFHWAITISHILPLKG